MRSLLAMAVAGGALYGAAYLLPAWPCWSLFVVAALVAWPVWYAGAEYALFERRALLAGALVDESRLRRWLWAGRVTRVLQAFAAIFWAVLLVGLAAILDRWQWLVLAADVALLALLMGPLRRRLVSEVRFEHVDVVARRWPLTLLNLALLAIAFFTIDFFLVGAPDTRGLTWQAVFDQAWRERMDAAACDGFGALTGFLAGVERLTWHAAEVMIPALPHREMKLAAWAAFLLQAGLLAYAFTKFALGAAALAGSARRGPRAASPWSLAFWGTTLLLAALYFYGLYGWRGFDAAQLHQRARQAVMWANPCKPDYTKVTALATNAREQLETARTAAKEKASVEIERRLDAIFGEAEQGVDRYLDWYFTVLGEYERLGALATGQLDELMVGSLERHLFGDGMLGDRLERASVEIAKTSEAHLAAVGIGLGANIQARVREEPCGLGALDLAPVVEVRRDVARAASALGAGALVGGIAVRSFGRTIAAKTAGRAASRNTFRVAGSLLGKNVTKRGGAVIMSATAAAAVCAGGGPLAVLCGIGAAVVTWLLADQAFVRIDEALFRDAMRAEILAALAEQRRELSEQLRVQHHAAIDQMAGAIGEAIDRVFVPVRHGI